MKKILFSAAFLSCLTINLNIAMGEEVAITTSGATCYQLNSYTGEETSKNATFFAKTEIAGQPEVTVTCINRDSRNSHRYINNLEKNGEWFNLYTAAEGLAPRYVIEVPEGYAIDAVRAKLTVVKGSKIEWTVKDEVIRSSSSGSDLSLEGLNTRILSLYPALTTTAIPTLFKDFYITVIEANENTVEEPLGVELEAFTVFDNANSSVPYRIPAIGKNLDGDLIAVADYRYSGSDIGIATNGKLDLRFRIYDAKTGEWGDVQTLKAAYGEGSANVAFGDPCIVGDRESNRMMVTSCCGNVSYPAGTHSNHMGWARFYSEDGGKTWSDYEEISEQVFRQLDKRSNGTINSFFIGSGKISQSSRIKVGDYYRLYCAALVRDHVGTGVNYVLYSDDFGLNWNVLGDVNDCPIPDGADEPKAVELPDGSVLVSSRISGGRYFNIFTYSDEATAKGSWDARATSNGNNNGLQASSNACNGEVMVLPVVRVADGAKMDILLQSVPFGPTARTNVGINYKMLEDYSDYSSSADIAKDWDGAYQVSYTTSGYSTMCLDKDNNIAFLMEESAKGAGYDIVYVKLSLEEITEGNFKVNAEALSSGIEDVVRDNIDDGAPVVYYDLQGRKVANPSKGIFIRQQGAKADKVVVK